MSLELVRLLIGQVPSGYEWLEYILAFILSFFGLSAVLSLFGLHYKMISPKDFK